MVSTGMVTSGIGDIQEVQEGDIIQVDEALQRRGQSDTQTLVWREEDELRIKENIFLEYRGRGP